MIVAICVLLCLLALFLPIGVKGSTITRDELIRLRRYADKARLEVGPPFE